MLRLQEGQFVSIIGAEVKGENDIYIVGHDYNIEGKYAIVKNEYCLYKVKLNGERAKTKYSIVFYNERYENENVNLIINIVTDLKQAKKEVNSYLKTRENNEVVTTFEKSNKQAETGSIIKFKDYFCFGTFGEYHIGKGMLFMIKFRDNGSCVIEELGKKGQKISNPRIYGCTIGLTKAILDITEVVNKIETLKGELNNTEENNKNEVIEILEEEKNQIEYEEEIKEESKKEQLSYTVNEDINTKTSENIFVVKFSDRFSKEEFKVVLEQIKAIGGYYSRFKKGFIFKENPTGKIEIELTKENIEEHTEKEPIEIDNINEENFPIDKNISKRENEGHWIFRTKERNHQEEILKVLKNYQEGFTEVFRNIEDISTINKYSRWLNSFKKKYYNNYYDRLKNDANNPSWTVTGRDGRNSSKDNKHMTRHDKLMREIINLENEYNDKLDCLQGELVRIERENFKNNVENNTMEYEFKRIKKEINISAINDYFKFPTGSYTSYEGNNGQETVYIIKSWGAWCVVNSDGMEFKNSRSKNLVEAKKKASYYLSQLISVA